MAWSYDDHNDKDRYYKHSEIKGTVVTNKPSPLPFCRCSIVWAQRTQMGHAAGGADFWGTALQAGRSWFRFLMVSLKFFIDINLPAALRPWGWLSP